MRRPQRGVARSGEAQPMHTQARQEDKGKPKGQSRDDRDRGKEMGPREMSAMHHRQTAWVWWMVAMLGVWEILAPLTFDYGRAPAIPSGGREVWIALSSRVAAMYWSDIISGTLLVLLGLLALKPHRPLAAWGCCFVGLWMSFAPLLFWCPSAAAYVNDTLVGALVIALTILIPGMPEMTTLMKMGGDLPEGWSYNPSSWPQRWIMIATGLAGWMVSRYLAAYQLGYATTVADPFLGDSTRLVLDSWMSHSLPISDAGLGSFAYTLEFLMGFMGSPSRWRTMPWMVAFFGILVIPLGLVHVFLVMSQPVMVGHWCTFCLLAAGIMLPMIPLEVDEVIAMGQHMVRSTRRGERFWSVFWKGGSAEGLESDQRTPHLDRMPEEPWSVLKASVWGMSVPWTLAVSAALGVWLLFAPHTYGSYGRMADVEHVAGALIITVSVIAMGEVVRLLRWVDVPIGLALVVAAWLVGEATMLARIDATVVGLVLCGLAVPRGPKTERYGLWDPLVR